MRRHLDMCPPHPGALLRLDVLPAVGKSKAEIARLLGISGKRLSEILTERKPITPELAVRLTKIFGGAPEIWIGMQNKHAIWHANRDVDVSSIPSLVTVE